MTGGRTSQSGSRSGGEPQAWPSAYARLLRDQIDLLGRLDAVSHRQRALINGEDADALLNLLDERQGIVERLEQLHQESQPFRDRMTGDQPAIAERDRRAIEEQTAAVSALARAIMQRDEQDQQRLAQRRTQIAAELAAVAGARRATAAYGGPRPERPTFQDREV